MIDLFILMIYIFAKKAAVTYACVFLIICILKRVNMT